ncbi:putative Dol-P-Glc:Glc(2)Man(9)GlcNAc(2)-PP-Dol alpha-1,2-glucosyltransferase [Mizuhopecten yessoensis]|uniref:putative Dol-P-Glc:Glc(2)Man(9)GlcNAc(2)-PP-Dol alpha-1,2-glucosyltransferase n=1 Tax=Mizuhopecten yessoensis TaxID=6573 RepID=UPI000B458C63|nr:putative Dol-P-Glc:Glc(2)Man(9)GlcNAc(2)-PP-Dol alpha-1,2-glucosyltransferase [Mizuhopecten yessoensis]
MTAAAEFATWSSLLLVALSSSGIALYINNVQKTPYMDEVFHVPQVQQYCSGNFSSWDPMITTLPGTYLASVGVLYPISMVTQQLLVDMCTTSILRGINILFTTANCYLLLCIYTTLHPQVTPWRAAAIATTLTVFPVMYFFTFLYYTDPGSIFFVLMMYYFHLQGYKLLAAMMGVVAIVFRQTNIIWVVFVAGLSTQTCIMDWMKMEKKPLKSHDGNDLRILKRFISLVWANLRKPSLILELLLNILISTFWYICVGAGFLSFIRLNDGIVVGDKSHHQACLNFPQIFYFLSVALVFAAPHMISVPKILNFIKFSIKNFILVLAFCSMSFILIYKFTYVHKYLLADNRHYVFYVWSKIFRRHEYVKFALIPVYYYAAWQVHECLKHKNVFWKCVYLICLLACTVPQKLMEFRYFIIPYLILRLNMIHESLVHTVLEFILYALINSGTIYIFGEKTFTWENSSDVQRFMW